MENDVAYPPELNEAAGQPQEHEELTKQYYAIGEVAQLLNLNVSQLRFWENEFDVLKPKKTKRGDRLFTKQDIRYIKLIHHLLKEKGYTVEGAKKKLHQNPHDELNKLSILDTLKEVRSFLATLKDYLDKNESAH